MRLRASLALALCACGGAESEALPVADASVAPEASLAPDAADAAIADDRPLDAPIHDAADAGARPLHRYEGPTTPSAVFCPNDQGQLGSCPVASEHCCYHAGGCAPLDAGCDGGADLLCDGTEDCPSGVCCFTMTPTHLEMQCASACPSGVLQICQKSAQCPSDKPLCCSDGHPFGWCSDAGSC
jgi:hypothetical protein